MRVRCIANQGTQLPASYLDPAGGFDHRTAFSLTIGHAYTVYALTIRRCGVWFYTVDESGVNYPIWQPAPLFEVTDGRPSRYWVFGFHDRGLRDGDAVFAVRDWAEAPGEFYDRLSDGEPAAREVFGKYRDLMDLEASNPTLRDTAEEVANGWLYCPRCHEAWRHTLAASNVRCPNCGTILRNPRLASDLTSPP